MAHLPAIAEEAQRVLSLDDFLNQIGHDMAHGQFDIAAKDFLLAQGPAFAHADAVEWANDREGQMILLPGALDVILRSQLLEAVGRARRRAAALFALLRRPSVSILENH